MESKHPVERPSREEVENQVAKMLLAPEFANAERMSRFLTFVVKGELDGDKGRLKESNIGVEVFDRTPGYDPKAEPIVRTEARRLRTKLESYYKTSGALDRIRIAIPRGGYCPTLEVWEAPEKPAAVETHSPSQSAEAIPTSPPPRRIPPWLFAGFGALAVLLLAFTNSRGRDSEPLPDAHRLTTFPGREESPSLSPDGTRFAFSWNGEQQRESDIYVGRVDGRSAPVHLTTGGVNLFPRWSPDGKSIAWWRDQHSVLIKSPEGGPERHVADADYFPVSWTPDGSQLLLSRLTSSSGPFALFLTALDSGVRKQITQPPVETIGDLAGVVSPNGKSVAFHRCLPEGCDVYIQPLNGGKTVRLTNDRAAIFGLTWTPDSEEIVFASRRRGYSELWRVSASGGQSARLVLPSTEELRYPAFGVNPQSGNWLLVYQRRQFDSNIYSRPVEQAGEPVRLIASTRTDSSPSFSADGKRIAFISDRTGYSELWASGADGSNQTPLTSFNRYAVGSPRWSPDGQIAFDVKDGGRISIFVVNGSGGTPRRVTEWGEVGRPGWSRDSKWIYYFWRQGDGWEIWKIPSNSDGSGKPIQVTQGGGFEGYESPDGKDFLYLKTSRSRELLRMHLPDGAPEAVSGSGFFNGWWAVQNQEVFHVDLGGGSAAGEVPSAAKPLFRYSLSTGESKSLGNIMGEVNRDTPDFAVSPDGKRILFSRVDLSNTDIEVFTWPQRAKSWRFWRR